MKILKKRVTVEIPIEKNEATDTLLKEIGALKAENKSLNTRLKNKEQELIDARTFYCNLMDEFRRLKEEIGEWVNKYPKLFQNIQERIDDAQDYRSDL